MTNVELPVIKRGTSNIMRFSFNYLFRKFYNPYDNVMQFIRVYKHRDK